MEEKRKSVVLYDAGGAILLLGFFGIPFGSIIDYLWNLLVLSVTLPHLPGKEKIEIGTARRLAYCFFITVLGFLIDWAYFELTWDTDLFNFGDWAPAMSQGLQFVWLLLPIVMIGLVNAALSYWYLELERKQAVILGAVIGLFTAPWLLPVIPYALDWIV